MLIGCAASMVRASQVSPDKPGYGGSDYQRERSLVSWADDLAALAGHLGLDRFALAGESGGGPFTLAAAHQRAGRVSVVALFTAAGRFGPAERAGMKASNRVMGWLARNARALNAVPIAAMGRALASPARRERDLQRELATMPDAAHAGLRIEYEAVADALRQGPRATVQELALIGRPWTFPLSEVSTPVHLWHGAEDRNVPIGIARRYARELPDALFLVALTRVPEWLPTVARVRLLVRADRRRVRLVTCSCSSASRRSRCCGGPPPTSSTRPRAPGRPRRP